MEIIRPYLPFGTKLGAGNGAARGPDCGEFEAACEFCLTSLDGSRSNAYILSRP